MLRIQMDVKRACSAQSKPSFTTHARNLEMFENGEWRSTVRDSFIAILCARERDEGKGEKLLLVRRRERVKNLHWSNILSIAFFSCIVASVTAARNRPNEETTTTHRARPLVASRDLSDHSSPSSIRNLQRAIGRRPTTGRSISSHDMVAVARWRVNILSFSPFASSRSPRARVRVYVRACVHKHDATLD